MDNQSTDNLINPQIKSETKVSIWSSGYKKLYASIKEKLLDCFVGFVFGAVLPPIVLFCVWSLDIFGISLNLSSYFGWDADGYVYDGLLFTVILYMAILVFIFPRRRYVFWGMFVTTVILCFFIVYMLITPPIPACC